MWCLVFTVMFGEGISCPILYSWYMYYPKVVSESFLLKAMEARVADLVQGSITKNFVEICDQLHRYHYIPTCLHLEAFNYTLKVTQSCKYCNCSCWQKAYLRMKQCLPAKKSGLQPTCTASYRTLKLVIHFHCPIIPSLSHYCVH